VDDGRNRSTVYAEKMIYEPAEGIHTSIVNNSTRLTGTYVSSTTNLSLQQDKKTSNYGEFPSNLMIQSDIYNQSVGNTLSIGSKCNDEHREYVDPYINKSHTYCRSLTCKNILIISAICLLGLLVISALILPNVLLYLMLPIIRKLTVNIFNCSYGIIIGFFKTQ
jgi:hypothetical protein